MRSFTAVIKEVFYTESLVRRPREASDQSQDVKRQCQRGVFQSGLKVMCSDTHFSIVVVFPVLTVQQ